MSRKDCIFVDEGTSYENENENEDEDRTSYDNDNDDYCIARILRIKEL